jgi:RNA polymerase sigma-70 factor (ECF subfamily)
MSVDTLPAQIEALRDQLMRFARLQLRNEAWAEDAVSDTVLAALEKPRSFEGRSQLKTWLIGILKHKIVDQLRRHHRECALESGEEVDEDFESDLFQPDGHFRDAPLDWGDPQAVIHQQQFLRVLDACVEGLPPQLGRVFLMREWMEMETAENCKELGLSSTNLWVILHRARLRLRECLQQRWFNDHPARP